MYKHKTMMITLVISISVVLIQITLFLSNQRSLIIITNDAFNSSIILPSHSNTTLSLAAACSLNNGSNVDYVVVTAPKKPYAKQRHFKPHGILSRGRNRHNFKKRKKLKLTSDNCWIKANKNKLIIFLHFHKAGGSSICDYARTVTIFAYPESNGNPRQLDQEQWKTYNYRVPFWDFSLERLKSYFTKLKFQNVSFIAMESYYFTHSNYIQQINSIYMSQHIECKIELITQFRDPFNRFVSHFFYDLATKKYREPHQLRHEKSIRDRLLYFNKYYKKIRSKYKVDRIGTAWEMHIRIFTGKYGTQKINETDFEIAKNELKKFDTITILEIPETHKLMEIKYGIKFILHSQECCNRGSQSVKSLSQADLRVLKSFEREYKRLNKYDYMLYDYAVKLAFEALKTIE